MRLERIADPGTWHDTRWSLHAVAEHVLAAYRYQVERRIGLVATEAGFGTPHLGGAGSVRVEHHELVVDVPTRNARAPLSTIRDAAAACGIEPGAPPVYTPVTRLAPDDPLTIDASAAAVLATWLAFGWSRLTELAGDEAPTLWPEHFDAAIELGDERAGSRGTFGVSPGDGEHPQPYLYVTHWADVADDPYWNDAAFPGASLGYDALVDAADPVVVARAFFATGRRLLGQQT